MSFKTLLYVEDDLSSRLVMESLIEHEMEFVQWYILANSFGIEDKLNQFDPVPDLIILDIWIEPLTGFEVLSLIRANDHYRDSKVVALTAAVMREEIDEMKQAGFDGVISKPLDSEEFPKLMMRIYNGEKVWHV